MSHQTVTEVTTPAPSDNGSGTGTPNRSSRTHGHLSSQVILDGESKAVSFSGTVTDPDVYATFEELDEPDRPELAVRAFKIGVLALKDARSVAKADYVEKEFQRMRLQFERRLEEMLGDRGVLSQRLHKVFGEGGEMDAKLRGFFGDDGRFKLLMEEFLGEDGKLERAVEDAVGEDGSFRRSLNDFFGEDGRLHGEMERVFGEDGGWLFALLNPNDETTPLGKFRRSLEERFDPEREALRWSRRSMLSGSRPSGTRLQTTSSLRWTKGGRRCFRCRSPTR